MLQRKSHSPILLLHLLLGSTLAPSLFAQAPEGPLPPTPGAQIQPTPPEALAKITTRVTLVNAPVTVRGASGNMIHDLAQEDFVITDNGVPQQITHFDVGGDPVSLVIVIETSSRVDPLLPQLRRMGILLTEQVMGPEAEAAVLGFDESVDKLQDFTRSHDAIQSVFAGLRTGESGQHLFDAMAAGVEMLTGRRKPGAMTQVTGRRVLLVISEALDHGSDARLGEILRRAQLENVTIFSVGLSTTRTELQDKPRQNEPAPITPPGTYGMPGPPGTVPTPGAGNNQDLNLLALVEVLVEHTKSAATKHSLQLGAAATGGAYYSTFKGRGIEAAIDEIGGELHSQYMLSYTPTLHSADTENFGYHQIVVSLVPEKSPNKKITTRPGYYVPPRTQ
jgi:VWFA-related protein